jgi:hypothetical protein
MTIDLNPDFIDLLLELRHSQAEFVIVGGYAVAVHGHPRATKDLDIFVRPTSENATRVFQALARFGAPLATFAVTEQDFVQPGGILQLGLPPARIDIINTVDGINFDEAIQAQVFIHLQGHEIPVIGLEALLKNKTASARPQDLADVAALTGKRRG